MPSPDLVTVGPFVSLASLQAILCHHLNKWTSEESEWKASLRHNSRDVLWRCVLILELQARGKGPIDILRTPNAAIQKRPTDPDHFTRSRSTEVESRKSELRTWNPKPGIGRHTRTTWQVAKVPCAVHLPVQLRLTRKLPHWQSQSRVRQTG